jgi:uncharacterized protein (DUF433 family)
MAWLLDANVLSELRRLRSQRDEVGRHSAQVVFLYYLAYPEVGVQIMATATLDWSECPLVEVIPGKVSGAPLLKNTRLPVDAITGNYDAFRDEGLSPDEAIAETLDCYPEAGLDTIKAILSYRAAHQFQAQL